MAERSAGWLDPAMVARRLGLPADDPDLSGIIDAACHALECHLGYLDALTGAPPVGAPPFPTPPPADLIEAGVTVCSNLRQNPSVFGHSGMGRTGGSAVTGLSILSSDMLAGTERLTGPYRLANSPAGGAV